MNPMLRWLALFLLIWLGSFAPASAETRRFAVVAGANRGRSDRVPLRWAVSDAERFASVLTHLGGVPAADCLVLRDPSRQAFLAALASVGERATAAKQAAARTEVLLYYSGHADERGLMLGRDVVSYREIKDALQEISSDIGIAVLDACASGAITRLKGGHPQPAFLTDISMQMQGHAFLTSSSENESAQESERLQGSYFTHALVSGLRGAADLSGDGKVTLGEAYQFAFNETLAQTTATQAGAQHPSQDIRMAGTGDVVMTDVRETSSSLILGPDYEGRFFVRDSRQHLVAEMYKAGGRTVELGLEPGKYEIQFDQAPQLLSASLTLGEGERHSLDRQELRQVRRTPTRRRGPEEPHLSSHTGRLTLDGRSRVEAWGGFSRGEVSVTTGGDRTEIDSVSGGAFGLAFSHWIREDVSLDLQFMVTDLEASIKADVAGGETVRSKGSYGILLGGRYYFPPATFGTPLRPFLSAGVGPFAEYRVLTNEDRTEVNKYETEFGGWVGGGVDVQFGPWVSMTVRAGSVLRVDHRPSFGVGIGFAGTWGRSRQR